MAALHEYQQVGAKTVQGQREAHPITKGRRTIVVSSGKGGVGKSTVTVNLAAEFAARGAAVGIIDADIYGFSVPMMLGMVDSAGSSPRLFRDGARVIPPSMHGVQAISASMLVKDSETAVSWRGPMLQKALRQFVQETDFGALDFLFIDMPPGTGDVEMAMNSLLRDAELLVVTTPQPVAAEVAIRSAQMPMQLRRPIVGVVENMFTEEDLTGGGSDGLFGSGGGARIAARLSELSSVEVPLLASIPLSLELRRSSDRGLPIVIADPTNEASIAFASLADAILDRPGSLVRKHLPLMDVSKTPPRSVPSSSAP